MRRKTNMLCLNSVIGFLPHRPPCPVLSRSTYTWQEHYRWSSNSTHAALSAQKERTAHRPNCFHMVEGKSCQVIIEINTTLTNSVQERLTFQCIMQHCHRCLVSIVYTEAGEPGFWQVVANTKVQQKTTENRMLENENLVNRFCQ